jgi:hypothetical protein
MQIVGFRRIAERASLGEEIRVRLEPSVDAAATLVPRFLFFPLPPRIPRLLQVQHQADSPTERSAHQRGHRT